LICDVADNQLKIEENKFKVQDEDVSLKVRRGGAKPFELSMSSWV